MIFPGWVIANAIPYKYLAGLVTGQYALTGGVIRYATGTARGGQIVAHLLPAVSNMIPGLDFLPGVIANFQLHHLSGAVNVLGTQINSLSILNSFNSYQLMKLSSQVTSLSQATRNVLHFAAGTALLSGLSLAVSSIGFLVINKKLNTIDNNLKEIQKDVKAIREFLELSERAELRAALKDLLKVGEMHDINIRNKILSDRRQTLMKLNEKYKELFAHANTLETVAANEEYFALTALAYTRCTAELGMHDIARQEIEELATVWQEQAHRITNDLLLGQYPERFLASDFAEDVPISALVSWLDFANAEKKGYEWIDEFRKKIDEPWYKSRWQTFTTGGGLNRAIGVGLEKEKNIIIPTLQKFVARNNIFEGYISQYEMLATYKITPSELEQKIAQLPADCLVEGHYILQPEKAA
ncbi:hypothetical protein U27_06973 [Candidatus Vecturithrix granuli]|uniref:Uncharacterized protein n=1 Tax=Vecturithrix granuli TaxID=1499967 RepID=A0A081C5Y1_VECG1|nr:hypothetical protein U27_06973 [Candidatus Vecturithrix granuli]